MNITRIAFLLGAIAALSGAAWAAQEETSPRPVVVSPEEKAAFQEAVNQPGADPMIALGEKFLQDYPESQLRSHVYSALATAYQQKTTMTRPWRMERSPLPWTRITSCPWSSSRRSFPKGSAAADWKRLKN